MNRRRIKPDHLVLLAFVIGLAVRVFYVAYLPDELVTPDGRDYWFCSENILNGNGFSLHPANERLAHIPPLYPLLLAGLKAMGISSLFWIRFVQVALAVLLIPLVYWLGARVLPKNVVVMTVGLYAISPTMIHWPALILTESLAIILFTLSYFTLIRGLIQRSTLLQAVSIALLGLATLTRSVFIVLPLVFLAGVILRGGRRVGKPLALLGLFVLVLLPWSVRNFRLFDHVVPITLGTGRLQIQRMLVFSDNYAEFLDEPKREFDLLHDRYLHPESPADEYEADRALRGLAWEARKANPWTTLRLFVYNGLRLWTPGATIFGERIQYAKFLPSFAVGGLLFPFMVIGLVGLARLSRTTCVVTALILVVFTLVHIPLIGMLRLRMPVEVILYFLASVGLNRLWERYRSKLATTVAEGIEADC